MLPLSGGELSIKDNIDTGSRRSGRYDIVHDATVENFRGERIVKNDKPIIKNLIIRRINA